MPQRSTKRNTSDKRTSPRHWRFRGHGLCAGLLALAMTLGGCQKFRVLEENYPTGEKESAQSFLIMRDSLLLRHGVQIAWHRNGLKKEWQVFEYGTLQGYAFKWHPNGKLQSLEHFRNGIPDKEAKVWDENGRLIGCLSPEGVDCMPENERQGL